MNGTKETFHAEANSKEIPLISGHELALIDIHVNMFLLASDNTVSANL